MSITVFPTAETLHLLDFDGTPSVPVPPGTTGFHSLLLRSAFDAINVLEAATDAVILAPEDSARNVILPTTADVVPLTIRLAPGTTAPTRLLDLLNDTGQDLFWIDQDAGGHGATMSIERNDAAVRTLVDHVTGVYTDATWTFDAGVVTGVFLESFSDAVDPTQCFTTLTMRAFADQTLPLLQLLESAGSVALFRVFRSGAIATHGTEPADADIQTGECVQWYDPTAGAPLVMFKGKDSAGTVFAGSLALT